MLAIGISVASLSVCILCSVSTYSYLIFYLDAFDFHVLNPKLLFASRPSLFFSLFFFLFIFAKIVKGLNGRRNFSFLELSLGGRVSTLISFQRFISLECSCHFIFFQVLIRPAKAMNSLALTVSALHRTGFVMEKVTVQITLMRMDAVRRGRASDWKVFSNFQASVFQDLLFLLSLLEIICVTRKFPDGLD